MSWPMVRLGDVGEFVRGRGIKRSETTPKGSPCIRYGEIYTSFNFVLDKPRSFVAKGLFDLRPKIESGDLVLTLTGENKEEIGKTLAYVGSEKIAAGGDLVIWKNHGCDSKYLGYLMYSPRMIKAKSDASNGHIVVHLSIKKLQDIEFPLPPVSEQKKIVEKVERGLKRVEVLKGEFARMEKVAADYFKAALAEEFEKVEGERVRLGDVCETSSGGTPLKSHKEFYEGGSIPWLRSGEVCQKDIKKTDLFITKAGLDNSSAKIFPSNTVVVAMYGATAGQVGILRFESTTNQAVCAILPNNLIVPDYLYYQLLLLKPLIVEHAQGGAQPNSSQVKIRNLDIVLAVKGKQESLILRLDSAKAKSDALAAEARRGMAICDKMRKAILAEAFA